MRFAIVAFLPVLWAQTPAPAVPVTAHTPRLLLSPQRLKRLKRDRERQTSRWVSFAERVENVPDSSERGFELGLFYLATGNEAKGREAVTWAVAHPCETRQVALVRDWCSALLDHELPTSNCPSGHTDSLSYLRDQLLLHAARNDDTEAEVESDKKVVIERLRAGDFGDAQELYAAIEYLSAAKTVERTDLREEDPRFFTSLPVELLLNLKPAEVERPSWQMHVAALALVSIDPNLDSSQFLQAWAIEDRQTIHEGPGVGYEFLWADPYLPGVGYQNLDPWLYDEARAMLVARTNWSAASCWLKITPVKVEDSNCPADWQSKPIVFGHLTLVPKLERCVKIPRRNGAENLIIWKAEPKSKLIYMDGKVQEAAVTDASGLWRVPSNADAQACTPPSPQETHRY